MLPETTDTPAAEGPTPSIFKTDDTPQLAHTPHAEAAPTVREKAKSVKWMAAEGKRLNEERARINAERAAERGQVQALLRERQELQARPFQFIKERFGYSAQKVAEEELGDIVPDEMKALHEVKRLRAELDQAAQHHRQQAESHARVEQWNEAKDKAWKEFQDHADSMPGLSRWIDAQADMTKAEKKEALAQEIVSAVERIKKNPKTAPYADQYSDLEIAKFLDHQFTTAFDVKPSKKEDKSADDVPQTLAQSQKGNSHGKDARAENDRMVRSYKQIVEQRRVEGLVAKPAPDKAFSAADIEAAEKLVYAEGRYSKGADERHTAMLCHNAKLETRARQGR